MKPKLSYGVMARIELLGCGSVGVGKRGKKDSCAEMFGDASALCFRVESRPICVGHF
jgi:hypothetical protein